MKKVKFNLATFTKRFALTRDEEYAIDVCNYNELPTKPMQEHYADAAHGLAKQILAELLKDVALAYRNGTRLKEVEIKLSWFSALCAFHDDWITPTMNTPYAVNADDRWQRTAIMMERLYMGKASHETFKNEFLKTLSKYLGSYVARSPHDLDSWHWTINLDIAPYIKEACSSDDEIAE